MTTLQFLDLIVSSGPNQGMRYSVLENMYRVVRRYEPGVIADESLLNPDQQELILKHLRLSPKASLVIPGLTRDPEFGMGTGPKLKAGVTEPPFSTVSRGRSDNKLERGPYILLDDPTLSMAQGFFLKKPNQDGVWVNLLTEERKMLKLGDSISIGNTQLKVV